MEGQVQQVQVPATLKELVAYVQALEGRIKALEESTKKSDESTRDMTDDDARRILSGDLKDMKHREAAKVLGLSYGQVYSCRLEFTFKNIHKEMKDAGVKNAWAK
jgi:hypothetical protein